MEINSQLTVVSVLMIGLLLGLQHAIEADHLAAVSTIVSEKKSLLSASIVGGFWGIGHTISLFLVGLAVIVLKLQIPEGFERTLEACVGVMLVMLGANALWKLFTAKKFHAHAHTHGEREHLHFHTHEDEKEEQHHRFGPRSIFIGMLHGLAGSAALMLLLIPTIPSPALALIYILVFGFGSILGMMAMSFLIGLPMHFTVNRFAALNRTIRLSAGIISVGLGALILYEYLPIV
jgi:high-affinity nickel permease